VWEMGENLQIRPSGLLPLDVRLSGLALGAMGGQIRGNERDDD
jgi:hypothetical protein